LNQGSETGIGFKRLIAEYSGVPLGEELRMLRATSLSLKEFGF
jgi:hypothetical protein